MTVRETAPPPAGVEESRDCRLSTRALPLEPTEPARSPVLSLIIPCRNEAGLIGRCLDSLLANDYPAEHVEMLVVDGMSEDATRDIVHRYIQRCPQIRLVDNPKRIIPSAMNLGIARSRGDFILKVDAHSVYPPDYMTKCIRYLLAFNADMSGGVFTIAARNGSMVAQSIAMALSHPFASGNAYVKIGCQEPRWADAAAFGCWRKSTLTSLGLFNEDLAGSSDMDLNVRLRRAGGRILLVPQIKVTYYADASVSDLWSHSLSDGVWTTYVLKFGIRAFAWRHWVPFAFVVVLLTTVLAAPFASWARWGAAVIGGAYVGTTLIASFQIVVKEKSLTLLALLPLVFAVRHVGHGLGAAYGLLLAVVPALKWKGRRSPYG